MSWLCVSILSNDSTRDYNADTRDINALIFTVSIS